MGRKTRLQNHEGALTVWTVVESVPEQFRMAYVRVTPDSHVARISGSLGLLAFLIGSLVASQ